MQPAIEFETDWTIWHVLIVALIGVAAVVWAGAAVPVWAANENRRYRSGWVEGLLVVAWVAGSLAAAIALLFLPGVIMRHLPVHAMTWWVALGCMLAIALLAIWGRYREAERIEVWIPVGLIGLGFLLGLVIDSVTRAAASIPISVGGLVLLVVVLVLIVVARRD